MFEELKDMFDWLFPDADKLNLEEMQRRLDWLDYSSRFRNNLRYRSVSPQWMRAMFEQLKDMFEGLFPDADKLNLEEMQRRLDEQQAHSEKNSQ